VGYYDSYYRAEVRSAVRLTPNMVRVVLGGEDLRRFRTTGVGDERLVVLFPFAGERETPAPARMSDGSQDYPEEATRPAMRSYTVRAFDAAAAELTVDLVAHAGGVAAEWGLDARPGDVVYVTEAAGWYSPPADAEWQLLVADMTALPALGRIVEELAEGACAHAIVEVIEPGDRQPLASVAELTSSWLVGSGNGHGPSRLLEALRGYELPSGPGYLWFAGESAESRAVRKYLRHELGWSTDRYEVLGYWRLDKESWEQRYARLGGELEQVYEQALAEGHSGHEALELYDDALERAGL
jgi:NADPH-dependent ferric siderophore reductase